MLVGVTDWEEWQGERKISLGNAKNLGQGVSKDEEKGHGQEAEVSTARKRMGAEKKHPGLLEAMRSCESSNTDAKVVIRKDVTAPEARVDKYMTGMEEGGGMLTPTGSMSNNVINGASEVRCRDVTVLEASMDKYVMVVEGGGGVPAHADRLYEQYCN